MADDRIQSGEALLMPAVLSSGVALPGHRKTVQLEWVEPHRAVECAIRKTGGQLVVLPQTDRVPVELIKVGTLVDVELTSGAKPTTLSEVSVYGRHAVDVTIAQRDPFIAVLASARTNAVQGSEERLVRRASRLANAVFDEGSPWIRPDLTGLDAWELLYAIAAEAPGMDPVEILNAPSIEAALDVIRRRRRGGTQRRRHQRKSGRGSEAPESGTAAAPEAGLPDEVREAIDGATGIRGDRHQEEAVAFIKDLKWIAPPAAEIDLAGARARLDAELLGMEAVKEAVLDLLATWEWARLAGKGRVAGKTICLVGPPGVGKTSIAEVIAEAMERDLIRIAMGSVDDVYLVGSDQSYLHSQPGEIARRIRQSHRHPSELVFLLDEVDKIPPGRGHPAIGIVLALLDPTQQTQWRDHFLGIVPIDLSGCVFIATANELAAIPAPLLDRLQPLELPAYTREEQIRIGEERLWPRIKARLGVHSEVVLDDAVVRALVEGSPVVPGMRQLQGQLETILGRALRQYLAEQVPVMVSASDALGWLPNGGRVRHIIGFAVHGKERQCAGRLPALGAAAPKTESATAARG